MALAVTPVADATLHAGPRPDRPHFHPGSPDLHDDSVPGYGNGGYDVEHYGIRVRFVPKTGRLTGRTVVSARATTNLSRFHLDFALPVQRVMVNGRRARAVTRPMPPLGYGKELVITPARPIRKGHAMRVAVTYAAKPRKERVHGYTGWLKTATGFTVWDEPTSATQWWYPCNDYPSDKAAFDVRVTVPRRLTAISNGVYQGRRVHGRFATTRWHAPDPMFTALSFLTIGHYDVEVGRIAGTPSYVAFEHGDGAPMRRARADLARLPQVLGFLARNFGRYPFVASGALVSRTRFGTAFETQTRPTFTVRRWEDPGSSITDVVHESAHQWFGDSVTMTRWRHVWLHEGFATYAEWLWSERHGHDTAQQLFRSTYREYPRQRHFWKVPLTRPKYSLDPVVYYRGAMTLQALRNRVGDDAFFHLMRAWPTLHRHGNASTADFTRLAERVSGIDLHRFFRSWAYSRHRPTPTRAHGFVPW